MRTLKLKSRTGADGHLRLDVPTDLPDREVDLVVVIEPAPAPVYDFSDLAGTLRWSGNAVQEQRKLRDEWRS